MHTHILSTQIPSACVWLYYMLYQWSKYTTEPSPPQIGLNTFNSSSEFSGYQFDPPISTGSIHKLRMLDMKLQYYNMLLMKPLIQLNLSPLRAH